MLRFLTGLPPGKVRFTIIDPVGLGENFAAFMHLADYDEALVTSRIWTEPQHIEQRLADLTDHMENVIQKYLRNEFETIEEYNAQAGEVAEPFRVLVVANFPATSATRPPRRLVSIAGSGARCGVLHARQRRHRAQPCRRASSSTTWKRRAAVLAWKDGRFVWHDSDFEQLPADARHARRRRRRMTTAAAPRRRGGAATPAASRCRSSSSRRRPTTAGRATAGEGIDVPLGRAGATQAAALEARPGHVAARPRRRQDRLRQIDAAARPDHQPGAALQPRRGRAVPDRLQEGRRVQDLRRRTSCRTPGSSPSRASASSA